MENVTSALQNAARRLGENYHEQKLFDVSVGAQAYLPRLFRARKHGLCEQGRLCGRPAGPFV